MVTDEILQQAATNARDAKLSFLESQDVQNHIFSRKFLQKIKKLAWRANHPILFKLLSYAVPVLLVSALLFGLLGKPQNEAQTRVAYALPHPPQGYHLLQEIQRTQGKTYLYQNENGEILNFSYEYTSGVGQLFEDEQAYQQVRVSIAENEGTLYLPTGNTKSSVLIWKDSQSGALLRLMGHFSQAELIRLAESVQVIQS